jgi:hypothetical protein
MYQTKQDVFTAAVLGLAAQGFMRSMEAPEGCTWDDDAQAFLDVDGDANSAECLYRGPDGMKCAVGVLMTDEAYKPEMEHTGVSSVIRNYEKVRALFSEEVLNDVNFFSDLQGCHDDGTTPQAMQDNLKGFAKKYDLVWPLSLSTQIVVSNR